MNGRTVLDFPHEEEEDMEYGPYEDYQLETETDTNGEDMNEEETD